MKLWLNAFFAIAFATDVFAQPLPDYYTRSRFLFAPPAAFQNGLLGFANPASISLLPNPELNFLWSTDGSDFASLNDWGVFAGVPHFGFSVQRQKFGGVGVTDFRLATGWGARAAAFGLAYGWSAGRFDALTREKLLAVGAILRPAPGLSFGLTGNFSLESSSREGVGEIGLRPFGWSKLTLFADAALQNGVAIKDAEWSAGAALEVLAGFNLVGRYFKSDAFTLGLSFNFGTSGAASQSHFDDVGDHDFQTYALRVGGMKPSFIQTKFGKGGSYTPLNLKGRVEHLKYVLFDEGALPLLDILTNIEAAAEDPRVAALALNLSTMKVRPEHAWEIREALRAAQQARKKIVAFIDVGDMTSYHLASIADKIVLDPQGSLWLQGYALGKTYFKGALEKMGLGFDEWRYFKYKSAAEILSRDSMSDPDREQLQDYVDDLYELTRSEVCTAREFSAEKFDEIIDDESFIMPEQALELGLVDTLGRWSQLDDIIKKLTGSRKKSLPPRRLLANTVPSQNWGEPPKIAVVYGLGICAMDEGIRARWLERMFLNLAKDNAVKAVVFRVDSPGGDALASDLVAEALKTCRERKPVIVSQGQVAGSGGYWISMYADTIVAGAATVTGSIGVIGGWLYDKGFSEKAGMTSDLVKRGEHADLGRGVTLPFLNLQVPARNLNEEERALAERSIKKYYDMFVQKVAAGRGLPEEKVREIAEGRVYSGQRGKEIGLVDEIGGLQTAIAIAQKASGIRPDGDVEIIELPRHKGWLNLRERVSPISAKSEEDPFLKFIRMISEHPGQPLPLMIPGTYPDVITNL